MSNIEHRWALFQCRYPKCISYLHTSKIKVKLTNGVLDYPRCFSCNQGEFMVYMFASKPLSFLAKTINWIKSFSIKKKVKVESQTKDLFDKFNEENLQQWIKPEEFAFGPSGAKETLGPGSKYPFAFYNKETFEELQAIRYNLALTRKNAGLPPIFWMPFNQDKIPENLKHLVGEICTPKNK